MSRSLRRIKWKRARDETYTDITDAIVEGAVSATPHPDPDTDRPKGYSVTLILHPESTGLAGNLQSALLDVNPARLTPDRGGRCPNQGPAGKREQSPLPRRPAQGGAGRPP